MATYRSLWQFWNLDLLSKCSNRVGPVVRFLIAEDDILIKSAMSLLNDSMLLLIDRRC